MADIELKGCSPTPLASYLKGLGVMRLVSRHWGALRAAWAGESLVLSNTGTVEEIGRYILHDYWPTPIIAPWNGGSGFYEKDNKDALEAICSGKAKRFERLRQSIKIGEQLLANVNRSASPKGPDKTQLLTKLRATLPDDALEWFDAAILLTSESAQFPPLFGTGGNDGRLDFTNNFMQRLIEIIDPESGSPTNQSEGWLRMSLFGQPAPGLVKKAIGQFSPGQVGGPNASTGFESDSAINPWDFVLMMEGALLFAAAAVRRHSTDAAGTLSYPFTVRAVSAGAGNLGREDAASSRGELWMPLWRQPAELAEIRALLHEGRIALNKRPARDALDFIRAVHRLGGYRGVDRFQRFGLLMRSGKAYLAAPLERVQVTEDPHTDWIDDLERGEWLSRFRRYTNGDSVASRFSTLRRRLEDALFELARRPPSTVQVQGLLGILSEIQDALSNSRKARESLRPVPVLQDRWTKSADDGSPAFRIARALAGLSGLKEQPLPIRSQLFPVHPRYNDWIATACSSQASRDDPACRVRIYTGWHGSLVKTLSRILMRRLWLAEQFGMTDKPFHGPSGIGLDDFTAFLNSADLDRKIGELLPGLALCNIPLDSDHGAGEGAVPAAAALLKICITPDSRLRKLGYLGEDDTLPVPPGMLAQLAAYNSSNKPVLAAWRRLRASGIAPMFKTRDLPELSGMEPRRVAAAMLIPLHYGATRLLLESVLAKQEPEGEPA